MPAVLAILLLGLFSSFGVLLIALLDDVIHDRARNANVVFYAFVSCLVCTLGIGALMFANLVKYIL